MHEFTKCYFSVFLTFNVLQSRWEHSHGIYNVCSLLCKYKVFKPDPGLNHLLLCNMSEIEGINSIGKSVSVSFRVRVVRAGGRGEAAWARMGRVLPTLVARSQTFPPGRLSLERPFCAGARVLSFFGQKCTICKGFMQWDCSGCACARVLRECNCESLEHIVGRKGFKAF